MLLRELIECVGSARACEAGDIIIAANCVFCCGSRGGDPSSAVADCCVRPRPSSGVLDRHTMKISVKTLKGNHFDLHVAEDELVNMACGVGYVLSDASRVCGGIARASWGVGCLWMRGCEGLLRA